MTLLEVALAAIVSFGICGLRGRKRKTIVGRNYVAMKSGKGIVYVAALEMERVDPLSLGDLRKLREYSKALAKCCSSVNLEIRIIRSDEDSKKLLTKLENEIATLRVIVESDPSNVKAEAKLRYLEKLVNIVSKYPLTSTRVYYLLWSKEKRTMEKELGVLQGILEGIMGAEVRRLRGHELLKLLRPTRPEKGKISNSSALLVGLPAPKRLSEASVYVGMKDNNEPAMLSLDDFKHHIAIFGSTGSGKTTLLCTLIRRLTYVGVDNIIIFDPKGDLIKMCGDGIKAYGPFVEESIKKRKETAMAFASEVLGQILSSELTPELKTVVIIDEAWLIDEEILESMMREGRSRGTGVVVATHAPSDLKEALLHNAHTKFFLKLDKIDDVLEKLGIADEVASLRTGEAIMVSRDGEVCKVKIEPELQATTFTTFKSLTPRSDKNFSTSSASPSISIKKKLGTTLDW